MRRPRLPEGPDRDLLVLFVTTAVVLALYLNYGLAAFGAKVLDIGQRSPNAVLWQFLAAGLFFFAVPATMWRFGLKRPLAGVGLAAGDWRYGLKFCAFTIPLLVLPLTWLGSVMPDVRSEYPLARGPEGGPVFLLWLEGAYLLYYLGWEFLFRGVLILGIRERTGDIAAIGLSTLVTTAIHLGKPEGEVWGAVLIGFIFGCLVVRTRSILWPLLLHAIVGVLTDVLVVFGPGGSP